MTRLYLFLTAVFVAALVVGNTVGSPHKKHRVFVPDTPKVNVDLQPSTR